MIFVTLEEFEVKTSFAAYGQNSVKMTFQCYAIECPRESRLSSPYPFELMMEILV